MKVELILAEIKCYHSHICDKCGKRDGDTTTYQVKNKGWEYITYVAELCKNCHKELTEG